MSEKEEKKNQRIGWIVSGGIHVALLILFFFILAWKEPNPPLPEYGIELNFGLDAAGSGVEPPQTPVPQQIEQQEQQPEPEPAEPESAQQQAEPEQMETKEISENIQETQPLDNPVTEVKKATEKPKEEAPIENKVTEKVEKPAPKPETKPQETQKPTQESLYPNKKSTEEPSPSQGDQAQQTGDQGNPEGSIDSRALYGKQGGGSGASLDITGWVWDYIPRPNDPTSENGRIVFEIKIDDQGEIIGVKTIEKTVSAAVERLYRQAVEQLTFSKTSDNTVPAPISTGRITFIIKSK